MSDPSSPWDKTPPPGSVPPDPAPPRRNNWLWLVVILGAIALVAALMRAFPTAVTTGDDWANLAYLMGFLLLVTGGVARLERGKLRRHLAQVAAWAAIVGVLALGYAYRDVFQDAGQRLGLAFGAGTPVATGEREVTFPRDDNGHFMVMGRVNGRPVRFMVDTGATDTVLSPADAARMGVDVASLDYGYRTETANGVGYAAAQTIDRLEVGPIKADDFRVMVNKAPMSSSLLGMSFLGDLDSYQVRGDRLTLRWKSAD